MSARATAAWEGRTLWRAQIQRLSTVIRTRTPRRRRTRQTFRTLSQVWSHPLSFPIRERNRRASQLSGSKALRKSGLAFDLPTAAPGFSSPRVARPIELRRGWRAAAQREASFQKIANELGGISEGMPFQGERPVCRTSAQSHRGWSVR